MLATPYEADELSTLVSIQNGGSSNQQNDDTDFGMGDLGIGENQVPFDWNTIGDGK